MDRVGSATNESRIDFAASRTTQKDNPHQGKSKKRDVTPYYVPQYWLSVCQKKSWIAWDIEVVWDHAHLLLGISPGETPEEAALALLNNAEL